MNDSHKRPRMDIPKTMSEWVWDIIGFTAYFFSVLLLIYVWNDLPDKVPAHYNILGEVDRWGSKGTLIVLPFIAAFLALIMTGLEKFPHVHNYPERFNENNAAQFYLNSRKMLNQLKNVCLIMFSLITVESISIPMGWGFRLGMWFFPLFLIAMALPVVFGLMRQRRIR